MAAAMLGSLGLAGCGLVKAAKKIDNAVHQNDSVIDLFTSKLKSGPSTFEITYVTTGSSPSKIVYAVQPPNELSFSLTQTGNDDGTGLSHLQLIENSSGAYVCTPPAAGSSVWTCDKFTQASKSTEFKVLDFYTPAHWVGFLRDFSLAAGFAGDKISTSTLTKNGFAMQCVDFVASGVAGKSKICTTSQHLLGYVGVASSSTGFEITSYSTSPSAALFALPAGAQVKNVKVNTGSK